jgi:tetratricopeptide (TPR) repeat protein
LIQADRPKVRVRADATVQSPQIAVLKAGEVVEKVGRKDEWYEVILPNGTSGWVNSFLMLNVVKTSHAKLDKTSEETVKPEEATSSQLNVDKKVERHPYIQALEFERLGDFEQALTYFEVVLNEEPDHIESLLHASQAHIELEQFQKARQKLYRALELGEGASQLSRLYRGLGWPDSARKYEALETADDRGSVDQISSEFSEADSSANKEWAVIFALVSLGFLGMTIASIFFSRRKRGDSSRKRVKLYSKFSSALQEASITASPTDNQILELDRRIAEKRDELKANSMAYSVGEVIESELGDDEDTNLAVRFNSQFNSLGNIIAAQEERTRIYVDLNRLQMEKIRQLEREIDLLRQE